ncbi:Mis12 protein-domain-containing protein [Biscogniauxia mediterranea]|nr:Mis12 protein-domain-containing protein [Biscogniauxia mediterranea]
MTTSANSDTELLTEHFGYPPVSLIDDIINSVNILAERALNSVEQGLLNAPPSSLGFKPAAPKSKSKSKSQQQKKANNDNGDDDNSAGEAQPAELAKMEIEAGTHQLETLLCASIDRNFDKFEIYVLRNVLCVKPADVRDWMRLSHYEGLDFTASASSAVTGGDRMDVDADADAGGGAPTLDSINLLRRKLRESMRLNALLTAERARNEKLLSELRGLVGAGALARVKSESVSPAASSPAAASKTGKRASTSASASNPEAAAAAPPVVALSENGGGGGDSPFAFLHRKGDLAGAGGATPLTTTTAFTLSQMQALRALSASLRKLTPDLVAKGQQQQQQEKQQETSESEDNNTDEEKTGEKKQKKKKSWRRERLEYVEGATRRHLETVQGLELGRHGEVRDGEWQGGGRGLARGEVEGLERVVVGLLGGDDAFPSTTTTGGAAADDNGTKTTTTTTGGAAADDNGTKTTTTTTTATTTPAAKKTGPPDYSASASASRTRSTRKGAAAAAASAAAVTAATAAAGSTSTSSGSGSGSGGDADANGENDDKMDES